MNSKDFRKTYYSSLGVKTVEAKSLLDDVLSGTSVDIGVLTHICQSVKIPRIYRPLVWKCLLGVVPLHTELWEFVDTQNKEKFQDLRRAAHVLFPGKGKRQVCRTPTPKSDSLISSTRSRDVGEYLDADEMIRMLMLQERLALGPIRFQKVKFLLVQTSRHSTQRKEQYDRPQYLYAIADCILEICDGHEADAFWIFKMFIAKLDVTQDPSGYALKKSGVLLDLLRTHNQPLADHLNSIGVRKDCLTGWYLSYYANVMPAHCIEGIWDATISGDGELLDYLGLSILVACKRRIESCRSEQDFLRLLPQIQDSVNVDAVAVTAVSVWEKERSARV
ncbi:TBC1 domain member 7 [Chytriomyces hyalinus]|nr:TBC1 domain member 7 [Chytriomyces hyalinus]